MSLRLREKRLLFVLLVLGLAWQGNGLVKRFLLKPVAKRKTVLEDLRGDLDRIELAELEQLQRDLEIAEWMRRSLPGDTISAQRLYQQWLVDLANDLGIADVTPTAEQRAAEEGWSKVQVRMQMRGQPSQIARFLDRWKHVHLLHRILDLKIARVGSQLEMTALFEAVCLTDNERETLFEETKLAEDLSADSNELMVTRLPVDIQTPALLQLGRERMLATQVEGQKWTIERGIDGQPLDHKADTPIQILHLRQDVSFDLAKHFHLIFGKSDIPLEVADQQPDETPIDEAQYQYLVGTVFEPTRQEAWLYDRLTNQTKIVRVGSRILVGDIDAKVETVGKDYVELLEAGRRMRLLLGQNLRSMIPITVGS